MYNKGQEIVINASKSHINSIMDKKNIYWPIPEREITANNKGQLYQNYGYSGYNPNTPVWDNWEDAVADESQTE